MEWRGVGGEEELSPASVGSWAGGDNRKRARSAQRRVGKKARLTTFLYQDVHTTLELTGWWLKFNFELFLGVPSTKFLMEGTVPSTKFLLDGSVPSRYVLQDSTVPANNSDLRIK